MEKRDRTTDRTEETIPAPQPHAWLWGLFSGGLKIRCFEISAPQTKGPGALSSTGRRGSVTPALAVGCTCQPLQENQTGRDHSSHWAEATLYMGP